MHDDSGGVDDRDQPRFGERFEASAGDFGEDIEVARLAAPCEIGSLIGNHITDDRGERIGVGTVDAGAQRVSGRLRCSGGAGGWPVWTTSVLRGGNAWESNPPRHAERGVTGFEDRGTHRDPSAPERW